MIKNHAELAENYLKKAKAIIGILEDPQTPNRERDACLKAATLYGQLALAHAWMAK